MWSTGSPVSIVCGATPSNAASKRTLRPGTGMPVVPDATYRAPNSSSHQTSESSPSAESTSVLRDAPKSPDALVGRAKAFEALALEGDARRAWNEAVDRLEGEGQAEAFAALLKTFEAGSDQAIEVFWRAHATRGHESRWVE